MSTDSSPLQPVFSYFYPAYQFLQLVLLLHDYCTPPVSPAYPFTICFSSEPLSSPPTQRPTEKNTHTPAHRKTTTKINTHSNTTQAQKHTHTPTYPCIHPAHTSLHSTPSLRVSLSLQCNDLFLEPPVYLSPYCPSSPAYPTLPPDYPPPDYPPTDYPPTDYPAPDYPPRDYPPPDYPSLQHTHLIPSLHPIPPLA